MDIAQILSARGIQEQTARLYARNLHALNMNKPITTITFLKDPDRVMQKIGHLRPTTQRTYIIGIVSFLKSLSEPKARKLADLYVSLMNDYNARLRTSNDKTDAEKDNWMTAEEVQGAYDALRVDAEDVAKKRRALQRPEYDTLLKYLILSLYTLIPPRRNADFQKMKILTDEPQDMQNNYIDIENTKFIFNNYKTAKAYKTQIVDIPDELMDVVRMYLRHANTSSGYLVVNYEGQPFQSVNAITRILNSIFKRRVGSQMLRKMFHTNKYAAVLDELDEDARKMGHSIDVIKSHYLKK
jgi:integrase